MSEIISVACANNLIKKLLDNDAKLQNIMIIGEISNYKLHSSGHHYLTLKDVDSEISAVFFKFSAAKFNIKLENGMKVIVGGSITSYPKTGKIQLYIKHISLDGAGDLNKAFNELKEKLYKEGLFDNKNKKPIPRFPEKIGIITSPTGAAVRDIITVISNRYKNVEIIIYPSAVQGDLAPKELVDAINLANTLNNVDVLICGRGGGSIEDLWAFNDENVARAIFASNIPIISAVGHQPDITIADFVADVRAETPSNAAEIVVPNTLEIKRFIKNINAKLYNDLSKNIKNNSQKVQILSQKLELKNPTRYIQDKRFLLDKICDTINKNMLEKININRQKLIKNASYIDAFSPLKVLARGYTTCADESGKIIKKSKNLKIGDNINVSFSDGNILCKVEDKK